MQKTGKICSKKKKCDARAKLLFCLLSLFFFLTLSLSSASLDLKVPIISNLEGCERGTVLFPWKTVYKLGKGLGLGVEPPRINFC